MKSSAFFRAVGADGLHPQAAQIFPPPRYATRPKRRFWLAGCQMLQFGHNLICSGQPSGLQTARLSGLGGVVGFPPIPQQPAGIGPALGIGEFMADAPQVKVPSWIEPKPKSLSHLIDLAKWYLEALQEYRQVSADPLVESAPDRYRDVRIRFADVSDEAQNELLGRWKKFRGGLYELLDCAHELERALNMDRLPFAEICRVWSQGSDWGVKGYPSHLSYEYQHPRPDWPKGFREFSHPCNGWTRLRKLTVDEFRLFIKTTSGRPAVVALSGKDRAALYAASACTGVECPTELRRGGLSVGDDGTIRLITHIHSTDSSERQWEEWNREQLAVNDDGTVRAFRRLDWRGESIPTVKADFLRDWISKRASSSSDDLLWPSLRRIVREHYENPKPAVVALLSPDDFSALNIVATYSGHSLYDGPAWHSHCWSILSGLRRKDVQIVGIPPTIWLLEPWKMTLKPHGLPQDLTTFLREWLESRSCEAEDNALWAPARGWQKHHKKILADDLEAAGIQPNNHEGHYDYKAIAHQFDAILDRRAVAVEALRQYSIPRTVAEALNVLRGSLNALIESMGWQGICEDKGVRWWVGPDDRTDKPSGNPWPWWSGLEVPSVIQYEKPAKGERLVFQWPSCPRGASPDQWTDYRLDLSCCERNDGQFPIPAPWPIFSAKVLWPIVSVRSEAADELALSKFGQPFVGSSQIDAAIAALQIAIHRLRTWEVEDGFGKRTLRIPPEEPVMDRDPMALVLDIEAKTNTRLKDGGNPSWFIKLHQEFNATRDPAAVVSFADFCARLYADRVDLVNAAAIAGEVKDAGQPKKTANRRGKLFRDEKNELTRQFLDEYVRENGRLPPVSEIARKIGVSTGFVSGLPAYRTWRDALDVGREPKRPKMVSLTGKVLAVAGCDDDPLKRLIAEQEADFEPSAAVDDPPGKPYRVRRPR